MADQESYEQRAHRANVTFLKDLEDHTAKYPDTMDRWAPTISRLRGEVEVGERKLSAISQGVPAAQASRIDPRTVTTAEVHRMTGTEKAQYLAAMKGSDERLGLPDVGPFRMLSVEEARGNFLGRATHGSTPPNNRVPMPNGPDGKPLVSPDVKAKDVHGLSLEQKEALIRSAGMTPPNRQPVVGWAPGQSPAETGSFVGQRRPDGTTVPAATDRKS